MLIYFKIYAKGYCYRNAVCDVKRVSWQFTNNIYCDTSFRIVKTIK